MRRSAIFMASGALVSFAASATAAGYICEYGWKPGDPIPGVLGSVSFMFPLDPDGAGPAKPLLMLEGNFVVRLSRTEVASNFIGWDGTWFNTDVPSPGDHLRAWVEYEGSIVVAGWSYLNVQPLSHVARWNGMDWEAVVEGNYYSSFYALAVHDGKLFAGTDSGLAVLDGESMILLEDPDIGAYFIEALASYNGELVASGAFYSAGPYDPITSYLATWRDGSWAEFPNGPNEWVSAVAAHDGSLFIAGDFTQVGNVAASGFARWDGKQWHAFNYDPPARVYTFGRYQGAIIAGGTTQPNTPNGFSGVERWDGNTWSALGGGVPGGATTLAEFDGKLFAGPNSEVGFRIFEDETWRYLTDGLNDSVYVFGLHQGKLLMSGMFSKAGGKICFNLAELNGDSLRCHPSPRYADSIATFRENLFIGSYDGVFEFLNGEWVTRLDVTGMPLQLLAMDSGLIVGGKFESTGEVKARNIALWDGAAWSPLGDGLEWEVRELEAFEGGVVAYIASGPSAFSHRVMFWDGEQWADMGEALSKCCVYDFAVFDNKLLAAGNLGTIGGVEDVAIALWNGLDWEPFGNGAPTGPGMKIAYVRELDVYQGRLFATGAFLDGPVDSQDIVAQWVQGQWLPLGTGAGASANGDGYALQVYGNDLAIGGRLTFAGSEPSAYWARWGPLGTRGDFDGDGALERSDFELWFECASPPVRPSDAARTSADCLCVFNTDGDGDVDLADFARLQNALRVGEN